MNAGDRTLPNMCDGVEGVDCGAPKAISIPVRLVLLVLTVLRDMLLLLPAVEKCPKVVLELFADDKTTESIGTCKISAIELFAARVLGGE